MGSSVETFLLCLMGAKSSKEASTYRSTSSSSWGGGGGGGYSQSSYGHETPSYAPQQSYSSQQYYTSPQQCYGNVDNGRRLDRRYSRIADNYNTLEEVMCGFRV